MKAFPLKAVNKFDDCEGMDLRDYFAAKAMQAMIVDPIIGETIEENEFDHAEFTAFLAYKAADAMMKAREDES
jgi:hypothetical protein